MPIVSYIHSIPYVGILSVLILLGCIQLLYNRNDIINKGLKESAYIILLIFLGLRGFIMTDYYHYYPYFVNLTLGTGEYEPFFNLYTYLIKSVYDNYHIYIFINTYIDLLLIHTFLNRYSANRFHIFSLAVFFVFYGLVFEVNLLRNFKALLLFLLSIKYIEERKPIKYFILNIIGLMFHWSSLCFLPLYFFIHKKINLKLIFALWLIGNAIFLLDIGFLKSAIAVTGNLLGGVYKEKIDFYINSQIYGKSLTISFGYIERILTCVIIFLFYDKLTKEKKNIIFINSFFIFILLSLYLYETQIILTRVCALFAFSYWILWSKIFENLKHSNKLVFLILFSAILVAKCAKSNNNIFYKYDNLIWGIESYEERKVIYEKYYSTLVDG